MSVLLPAPLRDDVANEMHFNMSTVVKRCRTEEVLWLIFTCLITVAASLYIKTASAQVDSGWGGGVKVKYVKMLLGPEASWM